MTHGFPALLPCHPSRCLGRKELTANLCNFTDFRPKCASSNTGQSSRVVDGRTGRRSANKIRLDSALRDAALHPRVLPDYIPSFLRRSRLDGVIDCRRRLHPGGDCRPGIQPVHACIPISFHSKSSLVSKLIALREPCTYKLLEEWKRLFSMSVGPGGCNISM